MLPDLRRSFAPEAANFDLYTCPLHGKPLVRNGRSASCEQCSAAYPIEADIWVLDLVQRPDRALFDDQVTTSPIPLDLGKAEKHLKIAGIQALDQARILDVGCGLGDLTQGLSRSERIRHSDVYAFDHSIESLKRAMANIPETGNGNRVHFSTQDASRLFFPDDSFDLIVGSAVLHHFLDYRLFLQEAFRILKPGCRAVFSEPFLEGYLWPCLFLQMAIRELKIENLDGPEFGMARFIMDDTRYRLENANNLPALNGLADKHYFRDSTFTAAAHEIGYRKVWFETQETGDFYAKWMAHFLDVYQIRQEPVRQRAIELYEYLREYTGPALRDIVPHFKYILLEK